MLTPITLEYSDGFSTDTFLFAVDIVVDQYLIVLLFVNQ